MTQDAVDLFAGPGGWDVAARDLGIEVAGIELDPDACDTRRAAGHKTIEGDVLRYDPDEFRAEGQIASPPCQTFSAAGNGAGRRALVDVLDAVRLIGEGRDHGYTFDVRTSLVVEPLRWALDGDASWLAWEQVPAVLPVWEACADVLRGNGWHVATGKLHAEQFGVPQTRTRAVLIARRDREVELPVPTHSRFHTREPSRLDEGLLPWVSMGDALGWSDRSMRSNYGTGGDPRARGVRPVGAPAPTVTGKINRNRWVYRRPAPTIVGSRRSEGGMLVGRQLGDSTDRRDLGGHDGSVGLGKYKLAGERVSIAEAAALQTFPVGYPWQGSITSICQQIGNAVPPLLARAILSAVAF